MTPLEQSLLQEATGSHEPDFLLRTRTRVDTGRWWRTSPLWLCVAGGELILLAVGRRRHLERIPLADCGASRYNPAGGELVIAPAESLRFPRLAVHPSEALRALKFIRPQATSPNPERTNRC